MVSPSVSPRPRAPTPVSRWRPPWRSFRAPAVTAAAERASAFLVLEPGFSEGLGRAVDGVGGRTDEASAGEERSEPRDAGGRPGRRGVCSHPASAGKGPGGFGCDCPARSWPKCSAREREVTFPRVFGGRPSDYPPPAPPRLLPCAVPPAGLEAFFRRPLWLLSLVAAVFSASPSAFPRRLGVREQEAAKRWE